MKYFTKEELEDITKELIENPTRETLKSLNDKYNGSAEPLALSQETSNVENFVPAMPEVIPTKAVEEPVRAPIPVVEEQPIVNQVPNFDIPNVEIPKIESNPVDNNNVQKTPNFELPKLETPVVNNQNNQPINFTGNLFETGPSVANLMQTTDNFNSVASTMPTTEVPVNGVPFFGPHIGNENNPIPVAGPVNNMPANEPTMFGQMQQNYM